jgi:uncharacterized membrane protein required for colicin V production
MSWIDLVIVIVVVFSGLRGYARGAASRVLGIVGLGGGFLLGTAVAPSLSKSVAYSTWRAAIALFIILAIAMIGGVLGSTLGAIVGRSLRAVHLGIVDRIVGVAVGVAGAFLLCWLAAGLMASVSWGSLATGIQQSRILGAMSHVMPPVPSIEAKVQTLFRNAGLPSVFASVVAPSLPSFAKPSALGPLVTSLQAPSNVVKVLASGSCASESEGTAFYVTAHDVVTNAHVVAGHTHVTVNGANAQVALFDPGNDLAILRVPSQSATPFHFLSSTPSRGAHVRIVGFPLDATRTAAPGLIDGELTGQGRDIYNKTLLTKTVLAVEVNVQPGNSGSPVLDGSFVVGVIESKLLDQASTAYAIPGSVVEHDIKKTPATGTVSTHSCLN